MAERWFLKPRGSPVGSMIEDSIVCNHTWKKDQLRQGRTICPVSLRGLGYSATKAFTRAARQAFKGPIGMCAYDNPLSPRAL